MPACYKWNNLVIFKVRCEFTGTNDALKPFNFFAMLCNKNKKDIGQRSVRLHNCKLPCYKLWCRLY